MSRRLRSLKALALLLSAGPGTLTAAGEDEVVLWPEQQRAFLQGAPGLLVPDEDRERLLELSEEGREAWIREFLADPVSETPENELTEGIDRRQRLARQEFLSLLDDRARLVFLHGRPLSRETIECGITFKPLEIWRYSPEGRELVLYQPSPERPYRLWLPLDSKRALYVSEMEYWLEQWEELQGKLITAKRFDLQTCPETRRVEEATGVRGLTGFVPGRPGNADILPFLAPPEDLAAWARKAAATPLAGIPEVLPVSGFEILYPERLGQRLVTRFLITVPAEAELQPSQETEEPELILEVDGVIERDGLLFDDFMVRFKLEPQEKKVPIALAVDRGLRPRQRFVVHLRVRDEVGGAQNHLSRGFEVPAEPTAVDEPPVPEGTILAMGEQLARTRIAGSDSLLLVPPGEEVILGLWRAEALVTGQRISKVVFLLDGEPQMTRTRAPFSAELRLAKFPKEQVVRAEGYDQAGELVAADELVLNQPRGSLRVRIVEPRQGAAVAGAVLSRAEVVVPEERRVEQVEFRVNEVVVATLERPPWQAEIEVPHGGRITYLTVVATLDDGSRAEEVRFLNAPQFLEQVDVKLVELYTTVTDRSGRLIRGLPQEDFEVSEDGRPQQISKFELVEDLPLTVAIVIDTSTSMVGALPEAQRAALDFLESIITPRDRVFAVSFSDRPELLVPPTDDVDAVEEALEKLRSAGWTTLHDAVVTSLYYFRGVRGRRAMVLLSDGDDTASSLPFRDSLEYARRSGVAIYCVGLEVGGLKAGVRGKLKDLAEETGGRVFFISKAAELQGVYREIEEELRSQYLIAYNSDNPGDEGEFRTVGVEVRGGKLKARTLRGYYP